MNARDYYANRRALPVVVLTESEKATVARLVGRCKSMRTSQVIRTFEDDLVGSQMRYGDASTRDRAAYLSGLVVAEVAILRRNTRAA